MAAKKKTEKKMKGEAFMADALQRCEERKTVAAQVFRRARRYTWSLQPSLKNSLLKAPGKLE